MSAPKPLEVAAPLVAAPSVPWLRKQICKRRIPGRKIGRSWYMTDEDIAEALEIFRVGPEITQPDVAEPVTLSAASMRRRAAS